MPELPGPTVAEDSATDHEIVHMETLNAGVRQYPDGPLYFLTVGNGYDEERVTLSTKDRDGLILALRRAADQVEGKAPFNLPPVLETLEEFAARTGG
jgi:hypothetical protein